MSHLTPEVAELVDLFCEGDITPQQASGLRFWSPVGQSTADLLDCFEVHCELAWELRWQSKDLSRAYPSDDVPGPCSSETSQIACYGQAGAEYRLAYPTSTVRSLLLRFSYRRRAY